MAAEELRDVLELIEGEIQYGRGSLPECFIKAGAQKQSKIGKLIEETGRRVLLTPNLSLREVLEEKTRGELCQFLPPEIVSMFFELIAPDGYRDERMQRRALERSRYRLEGLIKNRSEQLRGECRVANWLGIMGGLFLILFLW